ncbi:MAG: Cof-type HAD-IIB family hydrolase [Culicoidibacterales bacterium]
MLKNKKIKMVFFDIDDTLVVKDKQFMPKSVPKAVAKLQQAGIKIGIASGRARYGVVPMVAKLDADVYVTINGQAVENRLGEVIYSNPLVASDVEAIVAWCDANDIDYGMVGSKKCAVSFLSDVVKDAITVVYGEVDIDPNFYKNNEIYQMWTFTEGQEEEQIPDSIKANVNIVRWHPNSCDLFPKNGSKARGIEKVLANYGLTKEEIIVFGDGLNDIEMFKYAGFSVAMGNAHSDLIVHADYLTKDIENHGIEHALIELGLIT